MRHRFFSILAFIACSAAGTAIADECPGNPDALGTSRILTLDTSKGLETGLQYHSRLPLKDKEIVLTFDDGPIPLYSERVRKALKAECVQATYFLVGTNALAYPDFVRKLAADGHTIGTHTMTHAMNLNTMTEKKALSQVDRGILAVSKAMKTSGNPENFAPFFRFPGLGDNAKLRATLKKRGMGIFDIDAEGGDWLKNYSSDDVLKRVMGQIHRERRGVVLLHDIQPRTAAMVPAFLKQLKKEGYRIVHIVPAEPVIDDATTVASNDVLPETEIPNGLRAFEPENDKALQVASQAPVALQSPSASTPPVGADDPEMSEEVQALLKSNGQQVAALTTDIQKPNNAMLQEAVPVTADEKPRKSKTSAHNEERAPKKRRLNPALLRQDRAQDNLETAYAERRKFYGSRQRNTISPSAAYAPQSNYAEVRNHPSASKYLLNSLFDSLRGTN